MKQLLVMMLLTAVCCTSCTVLPAEERSFVVALLLEADGDGYRVYGRIPTYQTSGGYRTAIGKGDTLDAALQDMESALPMRADLSQLRLAVADAALEERALAALKHLAQRPDVRQACLAAVTDEQIPDLAEAMTPATGQRLSKALDVLAQTRREQGRIPTASLADLVLMGRRETPLLPRVHLAGEGVDLSGSWPAAADGDLGRPLTAGETGLLVLLRGETKQTILDAPRGTANIRLLHRQISLSDDLREAAVHLTLTMTDGSCAPKELEADLAVRLLALLEALYAQGCDALGLGRRAVMQGGDMVQWQRALPRLRWTISVSVSGPA